jgi:transposase
MIDLDSYNGTLQPWIKQILALYNRGHSPRQIADEMWPVWRDAFKAYHGFEYCPNENNIRYALVRIGAMDTNPVVSFVYRSEQVVMLHRRGMTFEEIATHFGIRKEHVPILYKNGMQSLGEKEHRRILWERNGQIIEQWLQEKADQKADNKYQRQKNKGRPIDMGGPRDVWIERDPWSDY